MKTDMQPNKYLQGVVGLLAITLIIFVGFKARNTSEEYNYIGKVAHDRDTITISGEGKVTSQPDLAKMDLGVQVDGATVKAAQEQNTQKMNAITTALIALGVKKEDLQTSQYSIQPKIDWNSGKQTVLGYTVTQTLSVKVRDLDKAGDVLAKAGELGANQVGGISFTIDDPTSLKDDARIKAIADARKKAEVLAKQLGLDIVKVVTFSENAQGGYPVPMMAKSYGMMDSAVAAPSPEIQSGTLDVVSDVSVTFEVR